jgi:TfoX/Sxy family transcriptional regulator of competence genes
MATQASTADFLTAQVSDAGVVRNRKMFGEYALYCNEKVVALICDDQLFVKPTDAGRSFAGSLEEAPPYPGSKPFLLVEEDRWEDREWMTELVRTTAAALPVPKMKKRKQGIQ